MCREWRAVAMPAETETAVCTGWALRSQTKAWGDQGLAPQSQISDQLQIAVVLGARQVVQESTTRADHLEQPAPGMVVVLVLAQMPRQRIDAVGEQRDLHVGRAGVAGVEPVLLDDGGSIGLDEDHKFSLPPRRALLTSPPLSRSVMPAAPVTFNASVGKRQEYSNKAAPLSMRAVRLIW